MPVSIFAAEMPVTSRRSRATKTASSGRKAIAWITCLPLQPVSIVDVDGAASAEIDDQNREPDRRLAGGDGQYEHREHLPDKIAERGAERDEVDVHREQDQLDRHQDDDDILAVDEDAEHAEREQRPEERRGGKEGGSTCKYRWSPE